ncbi:glycosyltransferase [Pseudokineococcus marinus]|uniref:Galactofuranosyltransferase GlfT2 n=1 Tax=Pseudokineococcus marinus TaxID=351215 RepID=A0A849BQ42_9ACTN|nr:glycosyltransferase [Pseudokineococcus marinus]NNH23493.1 galactofuranosyltransferase GlfT2 [Pseudokineococcus marinus]
MSAPAAEEVGTRPVGAAARVLQRVVLPGDADPDVLPLYVEGELVTAGSSEDASRATARGGAVSGDQVLGRRRFLVPAGTRSSFATYFNAFPAGYWRRWTVVEQVRLSVRTSGAGTVTVYRSNAKGNAQRVTSSRVGGDHGSDVAVDLPLRAFNDGGWYWFDLAAGTQDLRLEEASWSTDDGAGRGAGTVAVSITTMNRPDYCARLLATLGEDEGLRDVVTRVRVVDQGTQTVSAETEHFPRARAALGDRLDVVHQANLGGSGGFARGMVESLSDGVDHVLLLDDDVVVEPEGILRAVTFADLARTPTIVGGHMFSMFQRSLLHALAEQVQPWRTWWGPATATHHDHDLGRSGLRSTPWLHRRVDPDFNGWWMCLIPTSVVRELGVSLPLFIKWDDAEYGLRAREAGVPTVSLPGVAVWHVPWTDKDDAVDWQAYFHARNRLVVALLHSPYARGGALVRESLGISVKHLLSMQYSTAELRLMALEAVLEGPEHLHRDLATTLPRVREVRAGYDDAVVRPDATAFPPQRRRKPPRRGRDVQVPENRLAGLVQAATGTLKQLRPVDELARRHPQVAVPHMDSRWWLLAQFDSALVSTADGTGAAWYRRDPARFRALAARTTAAHRRLLAEWPRLAAEYRAALPDLTSPDGWRASFALPPAAPDAGRTRS